MSNGHHLNAIAHDPIDQLMGKSMKKITPSPVYEEWPTCWGGNDGFHPTIQFSDKCVCGRLAS
jgi:hypothetical protein